MSCWGLVPVKTRTEAKSRLAPVLGPGARIALVRSMLDHVLGVLTAAPGIDHVAIASPERDKVPDDIAVLSEVTCGLNPALSRAVATLKSLGAREVLVVPGDLPYLGAGDVAALLAGMRSSGCALSSDQQGTGTNAIALDLNRLGPSAFRFLFGRNSFARHVRQAHALGLDPWIAQSPGLSFDLDQPEALWAFNALHRCDAMRKVS